MSPNTVWENKKPITEHMPSRWENEEYQMAKHLVSNSNASTQILYRSCEF